MGNLDRIEDYAWTEEDYKVSETIQEYLANFVKTGNPNTESLPEWPKAEANDETPPVMILDTESKAENAEDDKRFLFLDKDYTK